jgi:hypothetical protein
MPEGVDGRRDARNHRGHNEIRPDYRHGAVAGVWWSSQKLRGYAPDC